MQAKPELENTSAATDRSLKSRAVIAVFDSHEDAEAAVKAVERSGFDMKSLSIVGTDYRTEEDVIGYYSTGDRMKVWGTSGAFWGGLWGMLFGSAFFVFPGIGPLLIAGPLVAWIVAALEGALVVGGLSALGAAFYSIGIPKESIIAYETHLRAGKYVILAQGSSDEVRRISDLLKAGTNNSIEDITCTI